MVPRAIQEIIAKGLIVDVVHLVQDADMNTDAPTALRQDTVSITVEKGQWIIKSVNNVMVHSLNKTVLNYLVKGFP